jgi:hypothetical protein
MAGTVKDEIVSILTPIFGDGVKKLIDDYYDEKNSSELLTLARRMLTDYMGQKNADRQLSSVLRQHPGIKAVKQHG